MVRMLLFDQRIAWAGKLAGRQTLMNDLRSLDIQLLLAFDALMTDLHVTRAAHAMGVSQPAMSHILARLRELFGDPLLVRTTRGMAPTARAQELIEPVRSA